jgi:hypothetical protein
LKLYSLEELEILMFAAGSEDPVQTAINVRRRWKYILHVALAAQTGQLLDGSLPQVMRAHAEYIARATRIIESLEEWIADRTGRPVTDPI